MLCRTANDLYWVSRSVERAENTARLIDLAQRISMLPERLDRGKSHAAPWRRALDALGQRETFMERYAQIDANNVLQFLLLDPLNPGSIYNCFNTARENARAQRGAITAEMYEDLNSAWLDILNRQWRTVQEVGISNITDWVKTRSASFRGVTLGTLARGEAYSFMQLGAFIERAEWSIRLLDMVGSDGELPESGDIRDAMDYFQWSALLQSMSAFEAYRRLYRESVTPRGVTELMLLRDVNPRSLHTCVSTLHHGLASLAGSESLEVVRLAGALAAQSRYARIDDIISGGLESWLQDAMARLGNLGDEIHRQFMISLDSGQSQSQSLG
jgi:uncharacterized alpha-E superfamily protein